MRHIEIYPMHDSILEWVLQGWENYPLLYVFKNVGGGQRLSYNVGMLTKTHDQPPGERCIK